MVSALDFIQSLEKTLPPVFGRSEVTRLLPGVITPKTLANLHTAGSGPKSVLLGRKRIYVREDFVSWLSSRLVQNIS